MKLLTPNLSRDAAAFGKYFNPIINAVRHPTSLFQGTAVEAGSATPEGILSRIRNTNSQQLITVGVIGLEALGFFTVGEMIGKFKVVGYRGDPHAGSHH